MEFHFFEDLPLGGEWTTRRRTVTEGDLVAFSRLSGDYNPLYVDAEYAGTTYFGGTIASAAFLVATAIGLGSIDAPVPSTVALVGTTWRFLRPVRAGDTIHARWRLARKRAVQNPAWGLAVWQVSIVDQRGETAAEGELARLVARREPPPAPSSRRRRRRRSGAATAVAQEQAPLPEPAPADVPAPSRRRRGRRGGAAEGGGEPAPMPAPEAGPGSGPVVTSPPRRRRRRRSAGNGTSQGAAGGNGHQAAPDLPSGAAAPADTDPAMTNPGPVPRDGRQAGSLGRVLRRLRGARA